MTAAIDKWPEVTWTLLGCLVVYLIGGMIVLWIGMIWDCATIGALQTWPRALWLILLILTQVVGALIYYFLIFRKRPLPARAKRPAEP
ncbi:MAG: hypothetical protein WA294_08080 [Acidobacteriaceae bacterium]